MEEKTLKVTAKLLHSQCNVITQKSIQNPHHWRLECIIKKAIASKVTSLPLGNRANPLKDILITKIADNLLQTRQGLTKITISPGHS